ncbi:MAG: sugar kinase [Clostridia bacterium]|nr:sugar kinase [Clostridia bacterium]
MADVLTFGEIMLRLQPVGYKRIMQAEQYEAVYGGGEANVAVSLAQMGEDVAFLTRLPDNAVADKCVKELRGWGVDTSCILRGGNRMGIYFCEKGAGPRGSNVIYDRAGSSFSEIAVSDMDLSVLGGCKWLHFTGITPAVSDSAAEAAEHLLKAAKDRGVTVSCDLNYRAKLWSREKACKVMTRLLKYVDVLISNEEDCKDVFNLSADGSNILSGELSAEGYALLARKMQAKFPNISQVAFTLRESLSASVNNWSGMLVDKDGCHVSRKYTINIVDRVGGGDSFGAGLIYALRHGRRGEEAISFAVAASAIKHTIEGDFNIASVAEIDKLSKGDGSGRVQR